MPRPRSRPYRSAYERSLRPCLALAQHTPATSPHHVRSSTLAPVLLLSIDFEDWHQLVHRQLGRADWDRRGPALERQTEAVLACSTISASRATFFVLGMTAERYPDLVREAAARGHELACHGYAHERVYDQTREAFRADLERGLDALEAAAGCARRRLPGACLLDHPRHAVGLRRPRGARLRVRLQPVRLASDPAPDRAGAADAVPPAARVGRGALGAAGGGRHAPGRRGRVLARPACCRDRPRRCGAWSRRGRLRRSTSTRTNSTPSRCVRTRTA